MFFLIALRGWRIAAGLERFCEIYPGHYLIDTLAGSDNGLAIVNPYTLKHMHPFKMIAAVLPVLLQLGCSNPADKVPAASVGSSTNAGEAEKVETAAAGAAQDRYFVIQTNASKIGFIGSKVTGRHNGGFRNFKGELVVKGEKIADSGNKIVIDTASLWTDTDRLTGHLKSPDFFAVQQFPNATFESTSVTQKGTNWTVAGNLTLHGVTKAISFPASINVSADAVDIKAQFYINRFDFSMKYPGKADDLVRKEVVIKLDIKAAPGRAELKSAAMSSELKRT
jgi:polyisoprenoid-binding protein YceI